MMKNKNGIVPDYLPKVRHLWQDSEKEVIKFFHKRNGCGCLKKKYDKLRNQTSMGNCYYCRQSFKRKKFMLCVQCKNRQYCSKDCQRAHWPTHRIFCEGTEFYNNDVRHRGRWHKLCHFLKQMTSLLLAIIIRKFLL